MHLDPGLLCCSNRIGASLRLIIAYQFRTISSFPCFQRSLYLDPITIEIESAVQKKSVPQPRCAASVLQWCSVPFALVFLQLMLQVSGYPDRKKCQLASTKRSAHQRTLRSRKRLPFSRIAKGIADLAKPVMQCQLLKIFVSETYGTTYEARGFSGRQIPGPESKQSSSIYPHHQSVPIACTLLLCQLPNATNLRFNLFAGRLLVQYRLSPTPNQKLYLSTSAISQPIQNLLSFKPSYCPVNLSRK